MRAAGRALMSTVTASTRIAVTPAEVWKVIMDPRCLGDWVTIHRRLLHADQGPPRVGFRMDQRIHLRGVSVDVHWTLIECRENELAVWEGRGPARSRARTEYTLTADGAGTRFDYRSVFHPPLGPLGAIVSRALVGGTSEREAKNTLTRLQTHLQGAQSLSNS
jgi:uncharacterized protein YndB with AHSA1/START domain